MRKRSSLIMIALVLLVQNVFAQQRDSLGLKRSVDALNTALIQRNKKELKKLLSNKLKYGHSNGWIESKKEVIGDLFNGKLMYADIQLTRSNIAINENMGVVNSKGNFDVIMGGQLLHFKLSVLQAWMWKKGKWVLISRQSERMNN